MGKTFKRRWRRHIKWHDSDTGGKTIPGSLISFEKKEKSAPDEDHTTREAELLTILEEKHEKVLENRAAEEAAAENRAAEEAAKKKVAETKPKPVKKQRKTVKKPKSRKK